MPPQLARIALRVPSLARAVALFAGVLGGTARRSRYGGQVVDVGFPEDVELTLVAAPTPRIRLDHLLLTTDRDLGQIGDRAAKAGLKAFRTGHTLVFPPRPAAATRIVLARQRDVTTAEDPPVVPTTGADVGPASLDHVCLATEDLGSAVRQLRDVIGGDLVFGGVNEEMGTLSSQVKFGSAKIEMLQPRRDDALLAQFTSRYGPGLHHLTLYVHDVAAARQAVTSAGHAVAAYDVGRRSHWEEVYLRPGATDGLLVQLAWTDLEHDRPLDDHEVEAILTGRVDSFGHQMTPLR